MRKHTRGFSLIELVVSLAILAALTSIALRTSNGLQSQARYQQTTQSLTQIQNAILGQPNSRQLDGTPLLDGFVADTGGLPQVSGIDPFTQLSELWVQPARITKAYQPQSASAPDTEIVLNCGWRGPYLQLPVGTQKLADGWGHAYALAFDTPLNNNVFKSIQSLGSDNAAGDTSGGSDVYAADVPAAPLSVGVTDYQGTVIANVFEDDSSTLPTGTVTIKLFYPHINGTITSTTQTGTPPTGTFTFSNIPIGYRALKATETGADGNARKSIVYFVLPRGGPPPITLIMKK